MTTHKTTKRIIDQTPEEIVAHMDTLIARMDKVLGMEDSNPVKPLVYRIIDGHTGKQVGKDYTYANRNRARRQADKLDMKYGAVRYFTKPIYSSEDK